MLVESERENSRGLAEREFANDAHKIRIILSDPLTIVRAGTRGLLQAQRNLEVIAEAESGTELLQLTAATDADLVVMDTSLPDMDGVAVIDDIRKSRPELKIVVLTAHAAPDAVRRSVESGAHAFLGKDAPLHALNHTIVQVMRYGQFLAHEVQAIMLKKAEPTPYDELTPRQVEVLTLIAQGHASKQIGHELGLSAKTVDVHRNRIMGRLQIWDIANLTRYAIRKGLVCA